MKLRDPADGGSPHFQCLGHFNRTLPSVTRRDSQSSVRGSGRVASGSGSVDLGGQLRGRRGGCFPGETTLDYFHFLDSLQTRPDPVRP